MNRALIKETRAYFIKNIKGALRITWLFSSLLIFLLTLSGDLKSEAEPFMLMASIFTSVGFGFVIASTCTFPMACISFFQYFILKQKISDNEHLKSTNFAKVDQAKNNLNKVTEFFFRFEKVSVLEINGKKPSQQIRALAIFKLKPGQTSGSIIQLPIGCFYVPDIKSQSSSPKKVA